MSEETQDTLFDLLAKKAVAGLDPVEQRQLDELDAQTAEMELDSLEATAAAIGLAGLTEVEPMPAEIRARIVKDAPKHVNANAAAPWPQAADGVFSSYDERPRSSSGWFGWLGWVAATAACLVLGLNIYFTRISPNGSFFAGGPTPTPVVEPHIPTLAEQREELIHSAPDIIKANWAGGNVKDIKQISGDIVWSDDKQAGYMRFTGLPVNDATATCYQLWIFDSVQDKKTPIDGGIFDVSKDGEVIIPINAKINAAKPNMFALTIERHGGVVVSDQGKIAALAKVETRTGQGA